MGAAHPPVAYFIGETNDVELLHSQTTFLGINIKLSGKWTAHRRKLTPGDRIVLYTDGLSEARGADGEFFGTEGILEFTRKNGKLRGETFNNVLIDKVYEYCSGRITDDIILMSITIK